MIICPNCNYQNPEGGVQCEACYTPLPALVKCGSCGAQVQADASFCGQCGDRLTHQLVAAAAVDPLGEPPPPLPAEAVGGGSDRVEPDPLVVPDPLSISPPPLAAEPDPPVAAPGADIYGEPVAEPFSAVPSQPAAPVAQTQLQSFSARLLHVQTDTQVNFPMGIDRLHIGKPNDRVPPDIDISGFPESEIVSRVHANILVEGDVYYIEDVGSSNGTYINNQPLAVGNRHRLRPGDRIALGKGDKVSFIFQLT